MKAVLLDAASLGPDIDLVALREQVDTLDVHATSTTEQSRERLAGAEVAIVNKVVLDAATLEALPELKLICVLATGTNNIDMATANRLGIAVRNVTAYGTASVAQHSLMLVLALANRLPLYQRDVAAGRWNESPFFCLMEHGTLQLEGKRLVIVGQGELGRRVAALAEAFGMQVTFAARPGNEANDSRPGLAALAPEADVISLHCPSPRPHATWSMPPCSPRSSQVPCWSTAPGAASLTKRRRWRRCVPGAWEASVWTCCRWNRLVTATRCSMP